MGIQKVTWLVFLRWALVAIVAGIFVIYPFERAHRAASVQFSGLSTAGWAATNGWIRAAECAQTTRVLLALCVDGKQYPIADGILADDPGHALLLSLRALVLDRPVNLVDVARINLLINFLGMAAVTAALMFARLPLVALYFLVLSASVYTSWIGISPHPGLLGAASLASALPLIIVSASNAKTWRRLALLLCFGALALGLAALIREPIGSMGCLISIFALGYVKWRNKQVRAIPLLAIFMLIVVAWQTPRLVLAARDLTYQLEPAKLIQTHGTSHNLYLGLGAIENAFGIKWDDSFAAAEVESRRPGVPYVSHEYYDVLWTLYLERLKEDPLEVARIYFTKSLLILKQSFPARAPRLGLLILISVLSAVVIRRYFSQTELGRRPQVAAVCLAFIMLFVAQGAVAHHSRDYAAPISVFIVVLFAMGLDSLSQIFGRHLSRRQSRYR